MRGAQKTKVADSGVGPIAKSFWPGRGKEHGRRARLGSRDFSADADEEGGAAVSALRLPDDFGKAFHKCLRLLPKGQVEPAGFEEENRVAGLFPCFDFVRVLANARISGDDHPGLLLAKLSHQDRIIRAGGELVFPMSDLMFGRNQGLEAPGDPDRQIVVKEKFHAVSERSYSTASLTASTLISCQRAASSTEPLARTPWASVWVGIPSWEMVGWPKFRAGSTTMRRSIPNGHQRSRIFWRNSNCFKNSLV